jgi:hypothetical protein
VYHNVTRRPRDPEPPDPEPTSDKDEKKEKVIHTRVPERLETELRERAQQLGISVSNLVRNVLGHAFGLVGDIMADGASVARAARGGSTESQTRPGDVLGWQPVVMGKNAVCSRCNDVVARGADAAIAIVEGAGPRPVVCPSCLEEIRHGEHSNEPDRSSPKRGR